jgi:perosamine synthetase
MILIHNLNYSFLDLFAKAGSFDELIKKQYSMNIVFTADGRNALYFALKNLNLKRKDEIIIPSYVCKVVYETVKEICTPVLADIDENTYVIDPSDVEGRIGKNTKGILAVHLYGNPCDMKRIARIAEEHSLYIIEDVAQALGGSYDDRPLGSFGDYSFFSFRYSKDITSFKGGMLLAKSRINYRYKNCESPLETKIKLLALLLAQSLFKKAPSLIFSITFDMLLKKIQEENWDFKCSDYTLSNFQKNLLYRQYLRFEDIIEKRRNNARFYNKKLRGIVKIPEETERGKHTYMRYTIQTRRRDELMEHLLTKGIQTEKMYDYSLGEENEYPNSYLASIRNLNIPVHSALSKGELDRVVKAVYEFFEVE